MVAAVGLGLVVTAQHPAVRIMREALVAAVELAAALVMVVWPDTVEGPHLPSLLIAQTVLPSRFY